MNLRFAFMDRGQDLGLAVLRIGVGLVFLLIHGLPKLLDPVIWARTGRSVSYLGIGWGHQVWGFAAILAMTLGAACLITGFYHRLAAATLTVTMAVASIWKFYPFGGWDAAAYPLTMTVVCAGLFLVGPGKYSVGKN